jgi:tetratricopeptide (TPR) repeat protein
MDSVGSCLKNLSLDESIQSQEECLFPVYNGRFQEAEAFYERALQGDPQNVSLVIEYAKMLYRQCRYGACSAYISGKIRSEITLDTHEAQAINIINNAALVYSQGTLRRPLKEAREAHQRLRAKPMEEFGDAEVR